MTADLDWQALGRALRDARRDKGMTQTELALEVGLDRKTIGNYELGRDPATAPRIPDGCLRVAKVLGLEREDITRFLCPDPRAVPDGDGLATRMAARQIERDLNALAVEAQRFAEDATRFATGLDRHRLVAGDASRLAQSALQLAMQGARLDALRETIAYLAQPEQLAGQGGAQ
jgi:transcriptional regulator with XRE-family HTH domain